MGFDILGLFHSRLGENYELHVKCVNPAWAKVTQVTGHPKDGDFVAHRFPGPFWEAASCLAKNAAF